MIYSRPIPLTTVDSRKVKKSRSEMKKKRPNICMTSRGEMFKTGLIPPQYLMQRNMHQSSVNMEARVQVEGEPLNKVNINVNRIELWKSPMCLSPEV